MADAALARVSNELSLGSNILGFAKSVADTFMIGNSIVEVAVGIVRWLARECIDGKEFDYALELCNGLVFPNEYGMEIQSQIRGRCSKDKRIAGLRMTLDGSVGRMLAFDSGYLYLVTTTLSLMSFHPPEFAVEALCFMVLDKDVHQERVQHPYNVQRTRLKPVMDKVVQSIAYNVGNAGYDFGYLPLKLQGLCVHNASAGTFAAVVMAITRNSTSDVLLYSGWFYGDIYMWLRSHYPGILEVSVEGNIVIEERLGLSRPGVAPRVMMLIRGTCRKEDNEHGKSEIEISLSVSGKVTTLLKSPRAVGLRGSRPSKRRALYEVEHISLSYVHGSLSPKELTDTRLAAQDVSKWILSLPLTIMPKTELSFHTRFDDSTSTHFDVGHLLKAWPTIGRQQWGRYSDSRLAFKSPYPESEGKWENEPRDDTVLPIHKIVDCFPPMVTLFESIKPRCDCKNCAENGHVGTGKEGCLRETALKVFFILLGDVIAEGFGAKDASGMVDYKLLIAAVHKLFHDLVVDGDILWDTWFGLAAQVYSGYAWDAFGFTPAEGSSAIVAMQNGSLAVAAAWLDLTVEIDFKACFGFDYAEGRLSGIVDECAILQAEKQMDASSNKSTPVPLDNDITSDPNMMSLMVKMLHFNTEIYFETAIIGAGGVPYRLLTMVKTKSNRRIVDPTHAVISLIRSAWPKCEPNCQHLPMGEQVASLAWAIDEAVGCWESGNNTSLDENKHDTPLPVWVASVGADPLALNVAMSLSVFGCVVQVSPQLCHRCAVVATATQGRMPFARRILRKSPV